MHRGAIGVAVVAALIGGLMLPSVAVADRPAMNYSRAKAYTKETLRTKFDFYRYSSFKKTRCNARKTREKRGCNVEFGAGDVGYRGKTVANYGQSKGGQLFWRVKYRVTKTNYYCLSEGGSNCRKTYRGSSRRRVR